MFKDKFEFKREFVDRIVEKYGRTLAQSHLTERYVVLGEMIREYASIYWKDTKEKSAQLESKQMYYFSMEFLMGRLLTNNLMNLGIYQVVRDGLRDLNIDIHELEELESDPGLGNGGLGRLAACFLDSLASLSLPGNGITLRYEYGLFKQNIVDGYQVEIPDQWLKLGNVWEVRKPKHAVDVPFWGRIEMSQDENGKIKCNHVDAEYVRAVPCDVPIVGRGTNNTNTLRLWTTEASDKLPANKNFHQYLSDLREIVQNVYPDDSNEAGKYLRLKQQYLFVSAGLQSIIKAHLRVYDNCDNLASKNVFQLNDTHPVLCIPELMRLLMDEHGYDWDQAWEITSNSVAYTNHTVLSEALERWPIEYIARLLPRIYMIIEEINRRHIVEITQKYSADLAYKTSIIQNGQILMANLAIIGSFSVNGVAELHTDILINDVFKDFYSIWPQKFNNKTNGITHRRWLLYSNPQLCELLNDTIGDDYIYDPAKLVDLLKYVDDENVLERFLTIKNERKKILADFIYQETGISVPLDSIFDTLAKRLHAYKRQLLKCLHIIYLMHRIKEDPNFSMHKQTFIFAAKAAPAYHFAKQVIKLINTLSDIVERDPDLNKYIKVVFIPNYRVSVAEILMNATDVSEQISTAGKEASGTGNMKFMMNGAITLGTLDGANVEIDRLVGRQHDIIFGLKVEEVEELKLNNYSAQQQLANNPVLARVVNSLIDGSLHPNVNEFRLIYDELIYKNDEYFLLADFDAYCQAFDEVQRRYMNRHEWAKTCLVNIAHSGYFSSDRTISEYASEIWKIKPSE